MASSEPKDRYQKNPRVRKIFVRNSGAGDGCANFMGAWKKCLLFLRKTSIPIEFLVLEGGGIFVFFWGGGYFCYFCFFFLGGGKCRFYFYGREDFRAQKINANFFVQSVQQPFGSWTSAPKIVDALRFSKSSPFSQSNPEP